MDLEQYKCNNKREYILAIKYLMRKYTVMLDMVEEALPFIFPIMVYYFPKGMKNNNETEFYIGWFNYDKNIDESTIEIKNVIREQKMKRINV